MSRLYLDGDEELILTLYRGPTLRETIRNIRQAPCCAGPWRTSS